MEAYESETLQFYYQIHPSAELYCLIFLFYFQNLALTLFVTCINNLNNKEKCIFEEDMKLCFLFRLSVFTLHFNALDWIDDCGSC